MQAIIARPTTHCQKGNNGYFYCYHQFILNLTQVVDFYQKTLPTFIIQLYQGENTPLITPKNKD
ncbi:MAG: hypothetical protein PWP04_1661 [Candidatus Atribacteria bacterium]|nr:hypothetical protein [Candidatus Atribacteria bacterium]